MRKSLTVAMLLFLVGLAASLGAGISMGFAEALSDDGSLTGRGRPVVRGAVCGLMTALGGLGHTIPYLLPNEHWELATGISVGVVVVELGVISWIRNRYMDTPLLSAVFQVVVGGVLVLGRQVPHRLGPRLQPSFVINRLLDPALLLNRPVLR